jgi:hypothetical protein
MRHSYAQIENAARRLEERAGRLDPATSAVDDQSDLPAIAEAADQARRNESLVTEQVAAARARGRSWKRIAVALGVSPAGLQARSLPLLSGVGEQ